MVQRSMEADTLPPVHTSQQLQRTLNRVNKKSARGSGNGSGSGAQILRTGSGSSRGSSPMVDTLRMTASTNKLPPKTASYEDFIMESLMEHCRTLQARVQDLETQLTVSENEKEGYLYDLDNLRRQIDEKNMQVTDTDSAGSHSASVRSIPVPLISAARQNYNKPRSDKQQVETSVSDVVETDMNASRPMSRQENEEAVVHTVNDMDSKIRELRLIFHPIDPLEERTIAVIKIAALIRGWLARRRYQKYWKAMYEFRLGRVKKFLFLIETDLTTAGNIESGTRSLVMKRNTATVQKIFERWCYICRQTAPFRRANMQAAENKFQAKRLELLAKTFLAFKNGTIGGDSHKQVRKERRAMVERLRLELKEKNQHTEGKRKLVITELELKRAVHHEVVLSSIAKRNTRHKRKVMNHFISILDKANHANKIALRHKFQHFAGKCFYAWSDWTYTVGTGLERKRWPGPRRYEVRYNRKLVEHFVKGRLKKMTFMPWKRFAKTQATVNIMFATKLTKFVSDNFLAWRRLTQHYKVIRKDAVSKWMGYSKDIISGPYFAWKGIVNNAVMKRNQQNGLVTAYIRWKQRQKLIRILQTWRHQALYGGVEGMYSRTTISKSLGEQKSMCAALQKMISRQTVDLEECKELVNREVKLRKKMEDSVVDKDSEIERLRMKGHHVDQELRRLLAVIESMAKINPAQIALLKEMQPEFNFQQRLIQPSLDAAGADNLLDDEERVAGEDETLEPSVGFSENSMSEMLGLNDDSIGTLEHLNQTHKVQVSEEKIALTSSRKDRRMSMASSSGGAPDVSQEDKRMLLRIKWVLSTILPDVVPYNKLNEVDGGGNLSSRPDTTRMDTSRSTVLSTARSRLDSYNSEAESDEDGEEEEGVEDGQYPHMSKHERKMEKKVQSILQDPAEASETMFLMGMLSFIKDGTTKSLSKNDSRDWAKVLLKSVGRDTGVVDALIPDVEDDKASSLAKKVNDTPEMEDWRSVLIHLQTFYPVGKVGRIANVEYEDDKNTPARGVLTRVRNMRSDLKEVVQYKVEKASRSKMGKSVTTNLALSDEIGDVDGMYATHDDEQPGINMYAGNLINHVGGATSPTKELQNIEGEGGEEEYDDEASISSYDPNKKSQILSMHSDIMKLVTEENSSYSDQFTLPSSTK